MNNYTQFNLNSDRKTENSHVPFDRLRNLAVTSILCLIWRKAEKLILSALLSYFTFKCLWCWNDAARERFFFFLAYMFIGGISTPSLPCKFRYHSNWIKESLTCSIHVTQVYAWLKYTSSRIRTQLFRILNANLVDFDKSCKIQFRHTSVKFDSIVERKYARGCVCLIRVYEVLFELEGLFLTYKLFSSG